MHVERIAGQTCGTPFPVYADLVDHLARSHRGGAVDRDPTVAHVLATCAGYSYADVDTVATMMSRLGFDGHACVRISQIVDAMFVYSTAYLVQSRCGRVVILSYRGTETATLVNWLGDADVGSESSLMSVGDGAHPVRVHAGFHLNVRAIWWGVIEELARALQGESLLEPGRAVESPLETLYVTGHSLGGAMAVLFALAIADRLRAVYTFGQPMAVCSPLPGWVEEVGRKVVRHVRPRDPIPTLPPAQWGPFVHLGQEFRYQDGDWRRFGSQVERPATRRELAQSFAALVAPQKPRRFYRFSIAEHRPQHYIAELRPRNRVSELGD
jgi:hypothetical protein